jgi:hypothetical protein
MTDEAPQGRFRLSRSVDLTAIVTLLALFAAGIAAFASGYWSVTAAQLNLDSQLKLLVQRIENDEKIAADKWDTDKAFSLEVRSNLAQITQALGDLRTLVASQNNERRR